MDKVRVRFAPSPTGYLHIGGARTALFNWLWARKSGGTFILRIEDTDQERSTDASVQAIFDSMRWLGLPWDEGPMVGGPHGPYFQMQRLASYRTHAETLIHSGHAYRCYCTADELDAQRNRLPEKKRAQWQYPGTCRDRRDTPDQPFVVRFKAPREGDVTYTDRVYGTITTPCAALQDQVLLRSNGVPLYNFGAVVDDVTMGVTLVARGRDHLVNTPPQILLYRALGASVPMFAHLPMMLNASGQKLSKRDGAASVEEYRDAGWLPEALLNYIARFGWSHGDQEIFSLAELVTHFDWAHVGNNDGRYDRKKALWVSAEHIRRGQLTDIMARVAPYLAARGLTVDPGDPKLGAAVKTVNQRANTLVEMAEALDFYFRPVPVADPKAVAKYLVPAVAEDLCGLADVVDALGVWDEASITAAVDAWLALRGLEIKSVAQPARVALTGRAVSPGLYETMAVLGHEVSVARLRVGAQTALENTGEAKNGPPA